MKNITTFIYFLLYTILPFNAISQEITKSDVLNTVCKVADNVVKNTTYLFYDTKKGILFKDLEEYGYTTDIVPQSPYNDWKYWNGVLHIGFNELGKLTNQKKYQEFTRKNFEFLFKDFDYIKSIYKGGGQWSFHMAQAVDVTEFDDCGAMGASLVELYQTDKKTIYKSFIDTTIKQMKEKQYRLNDGIYCRNYPIKYTVWADDLFMSVSFLARMGKMTGDKWYYDEAIKQVILFNKRLFDAKSGLMWHCYYSDLDINGGTFWGRANGWMMFATAQLLSFLPEDYPQRDEVLKLFHRQVVNTANYQDKSGMWHQILHKKDSYLETSCTAMFTYSIALGVNKGWIDKRYKNIAIDGWKGIKSQIWQDGGITNICTGTGIGNNIQFYYNRPAPYNDIHGIGAVILAGIEIYNMLNIK